MKLGVVIPTHDQYATEAAFRRIVATLERLEFDSAWFGDHVLLPDGHPPYLPPDWMEAVSCAIAGIGMTSRLSFGFDILVAPYRPPVLLAKMAATAVRLSGGRLILGLGIGWLAGEFETVGAPPYADRAAVTEEYLEVMRVLLETEGAASYDGKWVRFDRAHFGPRPAVAPPILVGGNHGKALRRAALLGDGWHPLFMEPEDYRKGRAEIERIRSEEGIARPFAFSYSASQTRLLAPGVPAMVKPPVTEQAPGHKADYVPLLPRDAAGRQRFVGTADQLREDCAVLAEAGVEQLVVRPAMPMDAVIDIERYIEQLELMAAELLPFCRGLGTGSRSV